MLKFGLCVLCFLAKEELHGYELYSFGPQISQPGFSIFNRPGCAGKTLTTAINTGRIAHAYIFTGIRGTGKTSTARILAKALNCLSGERATPTPCGTCENCRAIAAGQHIDVLEIDAASHTGVDNMRDILDAAQYRRQTVAIRSISLTKSTCYPHRPLTRC